MFYGPIPWHHKYQLKKGIKILTPSGILHTSIFHISEAIQNLPLEIREKIYKEFVAIKLRERKEMDWNEYMMKSKRRPSVKNYQELQRPCFSVIAPYVA